MNPVEFSRTWAHAGHYSINQVRKYTNQPYTIHIDEVAKIIRDSGGSDEQIIVSNLHDLLEDVYPKNPVYSLESIVYYFGDRVGIGVLHLTDYYTKANFPHLNREQRKRAEANRLALIEPAWQTVKYADMLSNTGSIVKHVPAFAKIYLRELEYLLKVMDKGDPKLYYQMLAALANEKSQEDGHEW